jgi:hypothetical protein
MPPHRQCSTVVCNLFGIPNNMKYLFFPLLLLSACNLDTKKTGMHKCSQSIEESKSNGVFRYRLKVDNPIINIGDNKTDTIKQIWVEDMWQYERKNGSPIIKKDSLQQVLILLSQLSDSPSDTVYLKHRGGYFGWNRVLFSSYQGDRDSVFIVKKLNNQETIIDTLVLTK